MKKKEKKLIYKQKCDRIGPFMSKRFSYKGFHCAGALLINSNKTNLLKELGS
jgi:hypothetical protein